MTLPATYLMGMDANDTIQIPPHTSDLMPLGEHHEFNIPDGETWTLESISYLFYVHNPASCRQERVERLIADGMSGEQAGALAFQTPPCDPVEAMMHLCVMRDNYEINPFTRFAGSEQALSGGAHDGLWWGYRNEFPHLPVVGPAHVRFVAFNRNEHPSWIYAAGVWTRRATE